MSKYLDFLKAHYEKVILSVVLIGLAAAAALMPMKVAQEQQHEEERKRVHIRPRVKPLEPIILTNAVKTLARVSEPEDVTLAGSHNLFNPVRWQRRQDGGLIRGTDAGVNALRITAIEPLRQVVEFRRVIGEEPPYKYEISVLDESESQAPRPRLGELGEENSMFRITDIKGDPKNPAAIELILEGEVEPITITAADPYEEVVGYAADLEHEAEGRKWNNQKVENTISFAGESYKIVAITEDEVVVSAESNEKQTPIKYQPRK